MMQMAHGMCYECEKRTFTFWFQRNEQDLAELWLCTDCLCDDLHEQLIKGWAGNVQAGE